MPVLRGFASQSGHMINVYCPYCDKFHYHGWRPDNPPWAIEHRGAHCCDRNGDVSDDRNPFRRKGYYIGLITDAKMKGTYQ